MAKKEAAVKKNSTVVYPGKNGSKKGLSHAMRNPVALKSKPLKSEPSSQKEYTANVILAGVANKPESNMTSIEKMHLVRLGISKNDLENLKEIASLDYEELSKALSVTRATLINKKGEDKFNAALSERIVGLADIYSYGYSVFGDEDKFNKWMFRCNQALAGQAPYDLIDNQFGREEVRNIIGRIDYGVYS